MTYPFVEFGEPVSIHYSCDLRRSAASRIRIGDSVFIAQDAWLNIPEISLPPSATLIIDNGCKIGRRCMFSAKNKIHVEADVLFGPGVVVTDHSHAFADVDVPIHAQGLTAGGTVLIERNCWLGFGAAVIATSGEVVIGRNSVIGANSVVTRSVPPFSVVVGNPARIVRRFDSVTRQWSRVESCSN